jgi:hypothetical protein
MSRLQSISYDPERVNLRSVNVPLFVMADNRRECCVCASNGKASYMVCCLRNVAEQLIDKGLASVVRHKRDDEDRSSDYDKLMTAEQG